MYVGQYFGTPSFTMRIKTRGIDVSPGKDMDEMRQNTSLSGNTMAMQRHAVTAIYTSFDR